jgi:hypothetical protein
MAFLCTPAPFHAGDLIPLGVVGRQLTDVEQPGENHSEPLPACQPEAGRVEDHIDQGRKGEEDDAEQRPDKRAECCVDEERPGEPDNEQSESWEEPREYGE